MRRKNMLGKLTVLLLFATLWPTVVLAEAQRESGIGMVTTLKGQATVTRTQSPPKTFALNFKDPVFAKDRISTQEQSLIQVLLGDKALLTVRELSELSITAEPSRPTSVDMAKGKLSLAVAQARLDSGESVGVRTPNAIAAASGAVMVIEVAPIAGQASLDLESRGPASKPVRAGSGRGGQVVPVKVPNFRTDIHVTSGQADIFDLAGKRKQTLKAGMSVSVIGRSFKQPSPNPPGVFAGLMADPQHTGTPAEVSQAVRTRQQAIATALAGSLFEDGGDTTIDGATDTDVLVLRDAILSTTGRNIGSSKRGCGGGEGGGCGGSGSGSGGGDSDPPGDPMTTPVLSTTPTLTIPTVYSVPTGSTDPTLSTSTFSSPTTTLSSSTLSPTTTLSSSTSTLSPTTSTLSSSTSTLSSPTTTLSSSTSTLSPTSSLSTTTSTLTSPTTSTLSTTTSTLSSSTSTLIGK